MDESIQSQSCPLAMLAQTCSKIKPTGTDQTTLKNDNVKKNPVKIAPKFLNFTVKSVPQKVLVSPQKVMVNVVATGAPKLSKPDPRAIFTVPLTDLGEQPSVAFKPSQNVVINGNAVRQHQLIQQSSPPQIFHLVDPVAPMTLIKSSPSQAPIIATPKVTPTSLPVLDEQQVAVVGTKSNNTQVSSTKLRQISASTIIPSIKDIQPTGIKTSQPSHTLPPQIHVCTQENSDQSNNATIQIMMPPNTPLSSLQEILQLAANAAKQYQTDGSQQVTINDTRTNVTANNTNDNNIDISDVAAYEATEMPVVPARPRIRKMRTQCICPNCINRRISPHTAGEKRVHICSFKNCNKEFNKTSHLKSHMRTHTGERPYACEVPFCNRKFTRSDELLRHHRTHTGLKRFQCDLCDKKFTRSDHLKKHQKIHT